MKNWNKRKKTKKGNYGENLVKTYLTKKGYMIYEASNPDEVHPIDQIILFKNKIICFIEVKTKPKRVMYNDTGIDWTTHCNYLEFGDMNNLPVFIVFVDESIGWAYGEYITSLAMSGVKENGMIYFPLKSMKMLFKISEEDRENLKKLSSSEFISPQINGMGVNLDDNTKVGS